MKRHPVNVASLVFGLLFVGVSVMWGLVQADVLDMGGLDVAAPVMLVSIGLAGLMASINKLRRSNSRD